MGSHRRCCCGGGNFNCEECYFVVGDDYDCSKCADGDTATVELDVSFTPFQWGSVENYTNCAFFVGPNAAVNVAYCDPCIPGPVDPYPRDINYACFTCDGSITDTGVPASRNCCGGYWGYGYCCPDPGTPPQCQCEQYDENTNPSIRFLCNRFNYNSAIDSTNNCASVSCGFKQLRYTFPDLVWRAVIPPPPGYYSASASCPNSPGTVQYFPEIITNVSRICVFQRRNGDICGPGNQGLETEIGDCGHVEIEDIGGGLFSSDVVNNTFPGSQFNIEYARYFHCTKILLDDPGLVSCPSGFIFFGSDFFQYMNPDGNGNRRFSYLRISTDFLHFRPKVEEITDGNVSCCTSLSSIINQVQFEQRRHAQGVLHYFRELPECSISNRDDYCFNRGVYKLGYVKFGYPKQFTEWEGKAWFQSNPFVTEASQQSHNIGRRLYNTCDGDNIPGDLKGIPTLPTLRTDFSYPLEITLV